MSAGLQRAGMLSLGRKWIAVIAVILVAGAVTGCRTLAFYCQAIGGQYELIVHRQSVEKLLADAHTPDRLRSQLELLQRLRAFAEQDLKLTVNGHYAKYVDVHRPFVVWNVEAAPEFSLEPKSWWYPVVGSLDYRGYFSERRANQYGALLQRKGYDVFVEGVEAYSTLGWFKDPALNTFIFQAESGLAETIFHELGHQRVFARSDTDFNEAFATTVGEEGARRWLRARSGDAALARYEAELGRTRQFVGLIQKTRQRLEVLFGDQQTEAGRLKAAKQQPKTSPELLRREKQQILERLQEDYAELKKEWGGDNSYDAWFARHINNAQLNSVAAYYDLVPGFERLLKANGGDLEKFYTAAKRLSKLPQKERRQQLQAAVSSAERGL